MKLNFLKNLYLSILVALAIIIVATPSIIQFGVSLLREEYLEEFLILIMFIVGYVVYVMYQKELEKNKKILLAIKEDKRILEDELIDAFRYIGNTNAQIDVFRSIFAGMEKYPKDKQEMEDIMELLAQNILKIIAIDWLIFRIVDIQNEKTLKELKETRGNFVLNNHKLNNNELIKYTINEYTAITSRQDNMNIKGFCVLPKMEISKQQRIMIEAIVSQLEMLFIIFDSGYYRN